VNYKAPCPGLCEHMHVDHSTGHGYTVSMDKGVTQIIEVVGADNFIPVTDISSVIGAGTILPGQTTHCSAFKSMYIGFTSPAGTAAIVSVNLTSGTVSGVTSLPAGQPLFDSLWATCDGSGVIGGVSFAPGKAGANGTATFVTIDARGRAAKGDAVGVPGDSVPNGMLTAASDSSHYLAAFYPQTTPVNATDAKGWLWAVAPFGGSDDFVSRIDTYLIGAAFDAAAAQR